MDERNESRDWLYKTLQQEGYNVGKDYDEFDSLMTNNPESRKWAYETATRHGYDVGRDYDEFEALINPRQAVETETPAAPTADTSQQTDLGGNPLTYNGQTYSQAVLDRFHSPANKAPNFKDPSQIASEIEKEQSVTRMRTTGGAGYVPPLQFEVAPEKKEIKSSGKPVAAKPSPFTAERPSMLEPERYQIPLPFKEKAEQLKQKSRTGNINKDWTEAQKKADDSFLEPGNKPFGERLESWSQAQEAEGVRQMNRNQFDRQNFDKFYDDHVAPTFGEEREKAAQQTREAVKDIPRYDVPGAQSGFARMFESSVAEEKYNNPEKIANTTLKRVQNDEAFGDYILGRMGIDGGNDNGGDSPQMSDREKQWMKKLFDKETVEVSDQIINRIYDQYKKENAPKSVLDYIVGKAFHENLASSLYDAMVRRVSGSSGMREQLRSMASEEFGENQNRLTRMAGGAAPFAVDMLTGAFGVPNIVGQAVVKGGTKMAAKQVVKEMQKRAAARGLEGAALREAVSGGAGVAERYLANNAPILNLALRTAGSAANFATYDVQGELARQLADGEFKPVDILKEAVHGAVLGGVMGVAGGTIGHLSRNATLMGKIGAGATGLGAETAIFGISNGLTKAQADGIDIQDVDWAETAGEAFGQVVGMKTVGAVMHPKEFLKRYRKSKDYDLQLNQRDLDELKAAGYDFDGIFKGLGKFGETAPMEANVINKATEYTPGPEGTATRRETTTEEAWVDADAYRNILQNPEISSSAKRKLVYIATGKILVPEPVFGATLNVDDNGRAIITTTNAAGNIIETKDFRSEEAARKEYAALQSVSRINTINGLETVAEEAGFTGLTDMARSRTEQETGYNVDDALTGKVEDKAEADKVLDAYIKNLQDEYTIRFNANTGREELPSTSSRTNGGDSGTETVNSGTETVNSGTDGGETGSSSTPLRTERRDAAYGRGVSVTEDTSTLPDIGRDSRLATARLMGQLPDTDRRLATIRDNIVRAVLDDNDEEADRLIAEAGLTGQQAEAIEQWRDAIETQRGIDDAVTTQADQFLQQRREELEIIRDEQGSVRPLQLNDGSTVYYKKGDLRNHYGGIIVTDGKGQTRQVPVRSVVNMGEPRNIEDVLTEEIDTYVADLQARYQGMADGTLLTQGQQVDMTLSGQSIRATVAGTDASGNVIFQLEDGSQMPMRPEEAQQAIADADYARIQQQLMQEAEAAAARQQTERFMQKIAGFAEGAPDLTASATDPQTATEFILSRLGADGSDPEKARKQQLTDIQATKEQMKGWQDDALKELERLNQWLAGNEDIADPAEVERTRQRIAELQGGLSDLKMRQQKWGEIRRLLMTKDELQAMEQQRRKDVFKARNGYQPVLPQRNLTTSEDRITLEDGRPNFGLTPVGNANNYLLRNFQESTDADKFIADQRIALRNRQRDEIQPQINDRNNILNAYTSGHLELTPEEVTQLVHKVTDLEALQDTLSDEAVRLREIADGIPALYERNNRNEQLTPAEQRGKELDRAKSREAKLRIARSVYKDYPEALDVINDQEPRDIAEYVSSNLGLKSINWEGYERGGHHVRGLQEELGSGWERGIGKGYSTNAFNMYLAPEGEGKGIEEVVHDLYEAQPDIGDGKQYTTEDLRNGLIDLISTAQRPSDISHRLIDNRIGEAEEMVQRQEEYERELEEDAMREMEEWAEANHLTPEEREAFEEFMRQPPTKIEQDIINQLIAEEYEQQNRGYGGLDQEPQQGGTGETTPEGKTGIRQPGAEEEDQGNSPGTGQSDGEGNSRVETVPGDDVAPGAQGEGLEFPLRKPGLSPEETDSFPGGNSGAETFRDRLEAAKAETDTNPTEAQKEAGNYKMGHIRFGGYQISIENPRGSTRSGVDRTGKPWSIEMKDSYGYIGRKYGADGDHLDFFINDDADLDEWNGRVFIVDQKNDDGTFDEHKVMYGYPNWSVARKAYERNYEPGWWNRHVMQMTGVRKVDFDKWLGDSNRKTKPFADYFRTKHSDTILNPADQLMADVKDREQAARDREMAESILKEPTTTENAVRKLSAAYETGSREAIRNMADEIRRYLRDDAELSLREDIDPDWVEDYEGTDPEVLAHKLIVRMSRHYYVGYDDDIPYIVTGKKSPKGRPSVPESIRYDVEDMLVADHEVANGAGVLSMRKLNDAARVILPKLEKLSDEQLKEGLEALRDFPDSTPVSALELELERRSNEKEALDEVMQEVERRKQETVMPATPSWDETEMGYMEEDQLIQLKRKAKQDLHTSSHLLATTNIKKGSKKEQQLFQNIIQAEADINAIDQELAKRMDLPDYQIETGAAAEPLADQTVRGRATAAVLTALDNAGVKHRQVSKSEADEMMALYAQVNQQAIIDNARRTRPNEMKRYAVVNVYDPYGVPKYFEKKQYAREYAARGKRIGGAFKVFDLDDSRQSSSEELRKAADIQPMSSWHGSGAVFTKFDHSHMNEGAGSQAFGWGTYVTSNKSIGKDYADLTSKGWSYKGNFIKDLRRMSGEPEEGRYNTDEQIIIQVLHYLDDDYPFSVAIDKVRQFELSAIRDHEEDLNNLSPAERKDLEGFKKELSFIDSLREEDFKRDSKNLYKVEIPDDTGTNYLDWYEEIPDELAGDIRERIFEVLSSDPKYGWNTTQDRVRLKTELEKEIFGENEREGQHTTFEKIYYKGAILLGNSVAGARWEGSRLMADLLSDLGYVGIKYPAGTIYGNGRGATNYVIFNEDDAKITEHIQFMTEGDGKIYGWTDGKEIYLTPEGLNPNTPIHEYTHIWDKYIQKSDPGLWKEMVAAFKKTDIWQQIRENPNYRSIWEDDDRMASEVHSRLTGAEGETQFTEAAADESKDSQGIIAEVKNVLKRFWESIARLFGYGSAKLDEFVRMPLRDLLNGVNPSGKADDIPQAMMAGEPNGKRGKPKVTSAVQGELFSDKDFDPVPEYKDAKGKELKDLTDEELLKAIGEKDGVERREYIDVYDQRHLQEQKDEYDAYSTMLFDDVTSLDDDYAMYESVWKQWKDGGYATSDRTKLLAQIDALEEHIGYLEEQEAERRMEEEEEAQGKSETVQRYEEQKEDIRQTGYDLTQLRLRPLKAGETSHVERRYTEMGHYSFTGSEHISSLDDVAYIFRTLQDAAVENSFMVLEKDGMPTIIHLGIGDFTGVQAPIMNAFVAAKEIEPDKVYFVHNHPSGSLVSSRADRELISAMYKVFGEKMQDGIIIDTTSGKYGVFYGLRDLAARNIPETAYREMPLKVYSFSKQVFSEDWNPETALSGLTASKVAQFVSSHRLGNHKKMSLIVMDQAGHVTGNIFLPWTTIDKAASQEGAQTIATYVTQMGGNRCIIYGNYEWKNDEKDPANKLARLLKDRRVYMQDMVHIDHSMYEKGMLAGEAEPDDGKVGEAKVVGMRQIEDDYEDGVSIGDSIRMADRVKQMAPDELLSNYNRLNSQMLDEDGLDIDQQEEKFRREWKEKHGWPPAVGSGFGEACADLMEKMAEKYTFKKMSLRWDILDRMKELGIDPKSGKVNGAKMVSLFRKDSSVTDQLNAQFNDNLRKYEQGELPSGFRFELGMPSAWLQNAGFENLPISMRASLLARKAGDESHPYKASELKDLVYAIQKPIATFKYTKENIRNLIVDVKHNDKHFLVGVTLNFDADGIEINSVSGLFPKESHEWVKWIQDGKALTIDQKEKVLDLIDSLRTNPAESVRIGLNLNDVAKIVKDFPDTKISEENLRKIYGNLTEVADETADMLGGVKVIYEAESPEDGAKGWYDPNDNTVHVVLPGHADANDVRRTVCHEKLGHEGLVALLGDQAGVNKLGQFVFGNASKDIRRRIIEKADDEGYGWNDPLRFSKAAQEVFADIAADGPRTADEFSLWTKVKHYLIKFLNRMGLRIRGLLNDHDLRYYVLKTGEALKKWDGMTPESREEAATPYDRMYSRRGRPRKRNDESMAQYLQRLREWEKWKIAEEQARENNDPMPDADKINERYEKQYQADLAEWKRQNGISGEDGKPGEFPKRQPEESPQEYAKRVADYETQADTWKTAPSYFDYMQRANDEYREAYRAWKERYGIREAESVDLGMYEGDTDRLPHIVDPEDLEAENRAEQDLAEAVGIDVSSEGARRHAKLSIIERRKNLESANAEDAVWIHNLVKRIDEIGKENGVSGKEIRETLMFIIEADRYRHFKEEERQEAIDNVNNSEVFQRVHSFITKENLEQLHPEMVATGKAHSQWEAVPSDPERRKAFHEAATRLAERLNELNAGVQGYNNVYGDEIMKVFPLLISASAAGGGSGMPTDAERFKNLPGLADVLRDIKEWYDYFYHAIEDAGLRNDAGYIEEGYVNHIWDREKSDPDAWDKYVENFQRTKSPNMREREVPTYMQGIEYGLVPKYRDIADILAYYSSSNNQAIANRKMLDDLSFIVVEELNADGEVVSALPLLNSEKPSVMVKDRYKMYQVPGIGEVWVIKDIQRQFANVFGTMRTQDIPEWLTQTGKAYDVVSSTAKKIELSFSAFHMGALTEVAMAQMRPDRAVRALGQYIILDCAKAHTIPAYAHPEDFKLAASHLVQLGATQDYSAADVNSVTEKIREIVRELADSEGLVKKGAGYAASPIAFALDMASKGMDKVLWNYLHDGLKIACFKMFAEQVEKRVAREGLTPEKREELLDEAGQYVNDTFGGQYWELLNVSPSLIKWLRRAFLSPDWLVSTQRHFLANFGFGSLYSESGFLNYLRYNRDNIKRVLGVDIPRDENRRFRSKNAKQCYLLGVCGFFYVMMNAINSFFRAQDEEKERVKADEMRRTNPEYKSPYELAYPDGMKWYDYTMFGNTLGQQTHLFLGRYDDGTEWYARWGKQFREFPELFMGRHGVEFPTPMMERMSGKANPVGRYLMYDLPLTVGMYGYNQPRETKEIAEKYGNTIALLAMTAKKFIPYSVPTQQDKEFKMFDLVMPSQKGFSRWKAVDYFKTYIQGGDMDGVMRTYDAAVMNGIDAEECLKAAIQTVKATQRKELEDGITDLQSAMEKYDGTKSVAEKKRLRRKIFGYLAEQNYKAFSRDEAAGMVEGFLNGEQPSDNDVNKYVELATSEDVRDEYRLETVRKQAKRFADEVNTEDNEARRRKLEDTYGNWLDIHDIVRDATRDINRLKRQLGKGDDDAGIMKEIREIRRDTQREIDKIREP